MLTGLIKPTSGSFDFDFHHGEDNQSVNALGVCPQHDVLWDLLTVHQTLTLYAGIKGVCPSKIADCVEEAIASVGLKEKRWAEIETLSGGQKRKVSVAIAFIGGSKTVILVSLFCASSKKRFCHQHLNTNSG